MAEIEITGKSLDDIFNLFNEAGEEVLMDAIIEYAGCGSHSALLVLPEGVETAVPVFTPPQPVPLTPEQIAAIEQQEAIDRSLGF